MNQLPEHIGIIMDGNGRWAKLRGLTRTQGHKQGLEAAKSVVRCASELGIKYVTLFTFSTENWKRTADEVGFLMSLIKSHLRSELAFYAENGIRVRYMGDTAGLPSDIVEELEYTARSTADFTRTTVVLAINYGGQNEIIRAIKKIPPQSVQSLTQTDFQQYLDVPELPQMDLLIRTGGEKRISNFLLWQTAYAELYFSESLWPDWGPEDLRSSINDYQTRERRFGGTQ